VFVMEVAEHAGWIAAAGGLAGKGPGQAPHIILFPEIAFDKERFLARVKDCVTNYSYCVIVVSEGAHYADGQFLADAGTKDAFGHTQLGGVGPVIANMVREAHGYKYHWAVPDYLQRASRHDRLEGRRATGVRHGQGGGRARGKRPRRGHAHHRAQEVEALQMGGRPRAARGCRERGEEAAARLHHRGRFRNHAEVP
jgi:hypothetical protein